MQLFIDSNYNEFIWRYLQTMISVEDVLKVTSKLMFKYWNWRPFGANGQKQFYTHCLMSMELLDLCTMWDLELTSFTIIHFAVCHTIYDDTTVLYPQQNAIDLTCVLNGFGLLSIKDFHFSIERQFWFHRPHISSQDTTVSL